MLRNARTECFGCNESGTKCLALTTTTCTNCRFFKTKEKFIADRQKAQKRADEKGLGDYALIRERVCEYNQRAYSKRKGEQNEEI